MGKNKILVNEERNDNQLSVYNTRSLHFTPLYLCRTIGHDTLWIGNGISARSLSTISWGEKSEEYIAFFRLYFIILLIDL